MKDVKSSALIPADKIPYANGQPYYVTISTTDNATGKPYTSWAKIEVQSPPAVVELARPSSLYITDEVDTLPLTWSLANFNGDGKEFRLVITNNTTSAVQGNDVNAGNQSGSFTMNIADVTNGYRDTYTVEVAAKNATDSTWSYDSFVLYVYDRAALQQLVVDGKDTTNGSTITLSNGEKEYIQGLIDSQNSTAAQQAVWDTGRDISLTADVSMDPDKPWLEVPDQFAWSAEDTTTASGTGQTHATLNYQQGALYEDITRYQRTSYGPTAEFRLSGLSDGTTKVTAEHVNTGTVAELIVNVDTLQDKLFLFQFTPAVETTLRYTNGDGVQKEVTSMADGRAAIYEESGIQGDVYLESQQGDTEYFGTLYNENLVSSEKDSTQLELYPVNYMTLRKAAQVPIYLKKPDGTPYLGEVTVHGGVYLNDAYAPDAKLDTDDSQGYNVKEGYTVDLAQDNGAHTFVFDMTQFSTEGRDVGTDPVDASDNLQFVFQMEAEGYAILAMKIGLFGQLSFQGAVRFLNAIGEAQAKVGYKIDFLGEVGIEFLIKFLIKFLFITYERVLWSQKIQIPSIQDNNWDAIEKYWEEVQQGNSGNEYEIITPGETQQASLAASQQPELLAADSSTGVALYGAPSTATLESRDYLESPRTYGGSLQVLRARAQTLAENTTSTGYQELIGNTVTATFGSGATARAAASTGTINLNVPNLGVSTFETVQQEDGKRVLRFSLYNKSAAQLENSGRTVKVGLFSDPECTTPIESQYASFSPVSTGTRANGAEFTIDSTTDLAAIDQGAYAGQITMDLAAYAKSDPENFMENGEIRSGGVTVDVTFIPEDWPFVDVTEDKWYYDAVSYVYQQGIMVGMSETTFEPNTTVNRAQVVQMLYNLEGQPQVSGDSGFSDIRDGQWYAKAVAWASANDVVAGYEDGTFRPTRAVTREEFAQILYNYAKCKGYGLSASADLSKFPDAGQVSSWAETAQGWANGNGLINGHDDGRMDPKGSTIRAQAASILMNFDKGFAQEG